MPKNELLCLNHNTYTHTRTHTDRLEERERGRVRQTSRQTCFGCHCHILPRNVSQCQTPAAHGHRLNQHQQPLNIVSPPLSAARWLLSLPVAVPGRRSVKAFTLGMCQLL